MANPLRRFFSKKEVLPLEVPLEESTSSKPSPNLKEEVPWEQLDFWIQKREKDLLSEEDLEKELQEYLIQVRKVGKELDGQLNQWMEQIDFSKLRYTTVGEINLFFFGVQALVRLLHTKRSVTLLKISRFNLAVKERCKKLMEKMGSGAIGEEFAALLNPREEEGSFSANPLWKYLLELKSLWENFEQKLNSGPWMKKSQLQRLQSLLLESKQNLSQLRSRLEMNKEHLQSTLQNLEEKEKECSSLRQEEGFEELEEKEEQLEVLSPEWEQCKQKVLVFFSPLKPYLQSYRELEPDNSVLEDYLENYLNAFYEDEELLVMSIIRKIRLALEEDKLKVNQGDLPLILERVEQTNSGELRELHKEFCLLKGKQLEAEKSTNRALSMKFEELKYKMEHYEEEKRRLQQIIKSMEEEIEKNLSIQQKAKEKFEFLVKEYFGKEVVLKV